MAKCANCPSEAVYRYQVTEHYGLDYCQQHLPAFLRPQRNAGLLDIPEESVVEQKVSKKKEVTSEETSAE